MRHTCLQVSCFVLFLFLFTGVQAQREKDNWYFGANAALHFPAGGNAAEITSASQIGSGVSATVSDKTTGQLLFYTDGKTVWNRNNTVMDNGTALLSTGTCAHVVTSPNPANTSQYYIFSYNNGQLRYALLDIAANGGLGRVLTFDNLLAPAVANRFTVAKHDKNESYWLITFRGSLGNDTFECYPITTAGIQPPIRSVMGFHNGVQTLGDMITNGPGNMLILTFYSGANPSVNKYTFSKTCGSVSTPVPLPVPPGCNFPAGATFSPNGQNLYVVFSDGASQVVQYNGTDFQSSNILSSATQEYFDCKTGPDGRIYIATGNGGLPTGVIDVIEKPDLFSLAAVYKKGAITLSNGAVVNYRFPAFMNDVSILSAPPVIPNIDVKNTCLTDTTLFTPSNMPFLDSLVWDFDDTAGIPATSTKDIPTHIFSDTGSYTVSLSWFSCGIKTSAFKNVQVITVPDVDLGPDTTLCHGNLLVLQTPIRNFDLTWSTGSKDTAVVIDTTGIYTLTARIGPRCVDSDTIKVGYYTRLTVDFFNDEYYLCEDLGETLPLHAGPGYAAYLWEPGGDTTRITNATKTVQYKVTVTNDKGCKGSDSLEVATLCDNTFFIPNAFKPDGDGNNDVFAPVVSEVFNYTMEIYTPWGQKIFESNNPAQGWDGTFNGYPCAFGAYIWKVSYQGNMYKIVCNYNHKGIVNLLR